MPRWRILTRFPAAPWNAPRCRHGRLPGLALILSLGVLVFPGNLRAQSPTAEYRLKAAFLYRFPDFVEWPEAIRNKSGPREICVLRPNPFGSVLQELVSGQPAGGQSYIVRAIDPDHVIDSCHVLFVPSQSAEAARPLLRKAATLPILTVGDDPAFLDEGGIINLRVVDGRIRFDVARTAAQRVGLELSSQLLRLALTVK